MNEKKIKERKYIVFTFFAVSLKKYKKIKTIFNGRD